MTAKIEQVGAAVSGTVIDRSKNLNKITIEGKAKDKLYPRTGHRGSEGE